MSYPEPSLVVALANFVNGLATAVRNRALQEADHAEKTLIAISRAAHATDAYENWRGEVEGKQNREKEHELAQLWREASIYVRRHDSDLAVRLENKGEYWINPSLWTAREIRDARIGLDQVTQTADQVLNPKLKRGGFGH